MNKMISYRLYVSYIKLSIRGKEKLINFGKGRHEFLRCF